VGKKLPDLSKNEWVIMKLCWKQGKTTARQVFEEAANEKTWEYQTVKTMLDRLVDKGYLKMEKFGPLNVYEPGVKRASVVRRAIDTFSETVLDNGFSPLFAHLVKGKKLSDDEITHLKQLIKQAEEGNE
jgi:predicted transcriptional regulator